MALGPAGFGQTVKSAEGSSESHDDCVCNSLNFVFCKDSTRIMYHCICILAPDLSQQKDRLSHMHLSILVFVFESYGDSIELIQVVIVQEKWSISSG